LGRWKKKQNNPAMIICSCNSLSDSDVRRAFACGSATSAVKVHRWNGCLIQCGECVQAIHRILDEEASGHAAPPAAMTSVPFDAGIPPNEH
jgi:bacterioferritin-associated ferredoxin